MTEKKECFGKVFPDLDRLEFNKQLKSEVFSVNLRSQGIGIQGRQIDTDHEAWDRCQDCESFRSCYDLSMARFVLDNALHSRF
jgi:hypothetical protein